MSNKDKNQSQSPDRSKPREGDDSVYGNPAKNNPKMNPSSPSSPGQTSSKQDQQSKTQR